MKAQKDEHGHEIVAKTVDVRDRSGQLYRETWDVRSDEPVLLMRVKMRDPPGSLHAKRQ